MARLLSIKLLDAELSLIRWFVGVFGHGAAFLPTILKIRQARERIINE